MSHSDLVLTALDVATPMLRRLAGLYHLEFDDIYQESALLATQIAQHPPTGCTPSIGYLKGAIRRHVSQLRLQRDHQCHDALSIDQPYPISSGDHPSLADILASPALPSDTEGQDRRAALLYQALRRLRLEEQEYLRGVFELSAYEPLPPDWSHKPDDNRTRHAVQQAAYYQLRHDRALAAAICS